MQLLTKRAVINDAAQKILSFVDMVVLITNEKGIILEANQSACQIFNYTNEELTGMPVYLLLPPHYRERYINAFRQFVLSQKTECPISQHGEIMGYRKDGAFVELEIGIAKFYNGNERVLVVGMLDMTERKRAEEKLVWQSTHDALTGLPNRSLIYDRLSNALQRSRRKKMGVAILFIDLDNFKLVNDTLGHEAGDLLLKTVSERLLDEVRPGDTVGRLAGDEFIVLCEQIKESSLISNLAIRINDTLRRPIEINGVEVTISASIGVAVGHGDQYTADDLLRSADTAMYVVKHKGRDNWQFFNEELQEEFAQKLSIIQGLRLALVRNELSVCFQPIVTASDGQIIGAELLLRWQTAEGFIDPEIFIPAAEMIGVISPIGNWVFREACKAQVNWRHYWGDKAPYVSINISARQLNEKRLAKEFADILRETGADPSRILLEITESALMIDIKSNIEILQQLTDIGLQVVIDDFGTGYFSLAQLIQLPVSLLKIGKSFIDGMEDQHEKRMLVHTTISVGHSLELKLIAKGVETEMQLAELKEYGCDFIQGYLFFRPMDEQTFIKEMNQSYR